MGNEAVGDSREKAEVIVEGMPVGELLDMTVQVENLLERANEKSCGLGQRYLEGVLKRDIGQTMVTDVRLEGNEVVIVFFANARVNGCSYFLPGVLREKGMVVSSVGESNFCVSIPRDEFCEFFEDNEGEGLEFGVVKDQARTTAQWVGKVVNSDGKGRMLEDEENEEIEETEMEGVMKNFLERLINNGRMTTFKVVYKDLVEEEDVMVARVGSVVCSPENVALPLYYEFGRKRKKYLNRGISVSRVEAEYLDIRVKKDNLLLFKDLMVREKLQSENEEMDEMKKWLNSN